MPSTVLATFDRVDDARDAIHALTEAGFDRSDIGLALFDDGKQYPHIEHEDVDGSEGAGIGAAMGSLFGVVVGLGTIVIPGIGPIIFAGPLAAALGAGAGAALGAASGAITGGLVAALVDFGVPEEEAGYYAETLRQGGALVSVTAHDANAINALQILRNHRPVDIDRRVAQWRDRGWEGYNPEADPFTADQRAQLERERENSVLTPDDDYEEYRGAVRKYPR